MKTIYRVDKVLELNHNCRNYCKIPYPGHKKGCPNYNKSKDCPPRVQLIEDVFDLKKHMYFVVERFNLKEHVEIMKKNHPEWSERQLKNLLYWQNTVRKQLKIKSERFINRKDNDMIYTLIPEAMGVMVIKTALKLGIPIEVHPANYVHKIALVGYSKV